MARYAKIIDEIAADQDVSRQTVAEWKRRPDFPAKTKTRGWWNLDRIGEWCKKNCVGKYRQGNEPRIKESDENRTLAEANRKLRWEQRETERLKKEKLLIEQAKELGELVEIGAVRKMYLETVATVSAVHDSLSDAVDRALPEKPPSSDAWPEIRERVLGLCQKLATDAASAMKELD